MKEAIFIKDIDVTGRVFWDTHGNPYHTVEAIINDEFVLTLNDKKYSSGSQYENTFAQELAKFGVIGVDKEALFRFCGENDINLKSSSSEVKKRDLIFNKTDIWKDIKEGEYTFSTLSDKNYEKLSSQIKKISPTDSNESLALKTLIAYEKEKGNISSLEERIESEYKVDVKNIIAIAGSSALRAGEFKPLLEKENISAKDLYSLRLNALLRRMSEFKSEGHLSSDKFYDFLQKSIDDLKEAIKNEDNKSLLNNLQLEHTADFEGLNSSDLIKLGFIEDRKLPLGNEFLAIATPKLESTLKEIGFEKTWGHEGFDTLYATFRSDVEGQEFYGKNMISVLDNKNAKDNAKVAELAPKLEVNEVEDTKKVRKNR